MSGYETTPPAPFAPHETLEWFGRANQLSRAHVAWPVIDAAIVATERKASPVAISQQRPDDWPPPTPPTWVRSAAQLIRQRRSAVDFDGVTSLTREKFLAILDATLPRTAAPPFDGWPFSPRLNLIIFVHRVTGLAPGLYLWLRDPKQEEHLRQAFHGLSDWEGLPELPPSVPLRRLRRGDLREFARTTSCHQAIAADSAFSLGMLAQFEPVLRASGAPAWRELFWEAGMIGQALYLAAEAAGMRGTGIGCYFDDVMHRLLGLTGHDWQSVYHFTVGKPVEDLRLRTAPPYASLQRSD